MFPKKKIQLCVVLQSLLSLSLAKQTGTTEVPSLVRNSNVSDMSLSRNTSTEEEVGR